MMLEDHVGDILRKARQAAGVSLEAAAGIAGIPSVDLQNVEQSGEHDNRLQLGALARALQLQPQRIDAIDQGWAPPLPDLGVWRELRLLSTTRAGKAVNCYLVWDEVSREAALFDTGWDAAPICQLVEENQLQLKHLFLTHTHEDHVAALAELRQRFPKIHLHTNSKSAPPQHRNRANDFIHLGSLRITNRETPGHAVDGVTYIVGTWPEDAPAVALVGDTIFAGSIATGFESWDLLKEKIISQIFSLPQETLLCPGHGPLSTVALEKAHNPFFR